MEYLVVLTLLTGSVNHVSIQPTRNCEAETLNLNENIIAFCIDNKTINTFKKALGNNKPVLERLPTE